MLRTFFRALAWSFAMGTLFIMAVLIRISEGPTGVLALMVTTPESFDKIKRDAESLKKEADSICQALSAEQESYVLKVRYEIFSSSTMTSAPTLGEELQNLWTTSGERAAIKAYTRMKAGKYLGVCADESLTKEAQMVVRAAVLIYEFGIGDETIDWSVVERAYSRALRMKSA